MLQITNWALGVLIILTGILIALVDSFPRYKEETSYNDYRECPDCHEKYYNYAETCNDCGSKLENRSETVTKQSRIGGSLGVFVAIAAVIAGIAIIALTNGQADTVNDTLDNINLFKNY